MELLCLSEGNRSMKKKTIRRTVLIGAVCAVFLPALWGCGSNASDSDYAGEEYDASYLTDEYASQLVADGAKTVTGTLEMSGSEENCTVTVHEKKIVRNDDYEKGYYIADRNKETVCSLSSDLGLAADVDGETIVLQTDDFIKYNSKNADSLYTVYLIGDTAELILPLNPDSSGGSEN